MVTKEDKKYLMKWR